MMLSSTATLPLGTLLLATCLYDIPDREKKMAKRKEGGWAVRRESAAFRRFSNIKKLKRHNIRQ